MSIEHEDDLYGSRDNPGPDFSEPYKVGFRMAKRYLKSVCAGIATTRSVENKLQPPLEWVPRSRF